MEDRRVDDAWIELMMPAIVAVAENLETPAWQTACARRVDAVVTRDAKNVYKAVKRHEVW